MKCDVMVVGAGPAGLGAAITSSKKGLKTILVEKSSEIGYPVKSSAFTWKEVLEDWNLPDEVMYQWVDSFYIYSSPSKREVEIDFGRVIGGSLNFHLFLQELAFQAIRHSSKIIIGEGVSEPILDGDFVCGVKTENKGEIMAKVVIDCSGPSAAIAKKVDLIPGKEIKGIGFEYEMLNYKVRKQNAIDIYVGESIVPVGYAWVFPTGKDRARVGVSTVFGIAGESEERDRDIEYYENLFLSELSPIYERVKDAQSFEIHTGESPMTEMLEKPYANGLLVAGDAASQNSVLLGEGIRYALEFGKMAAETAFVAIKSGDLSEDCLKQYKENCFEYMGEKFEVATDLLIVPTDEYWESLVDGLISLKERGNLELVLKYLKTDMTREDAIEIFPSFKGKYL